MIDEDFNSYAADYAFTLPTEYSNFHLSYQYDENMQPVGRGLGFTTSTSQEGGNYKMIGYNFGELILRHHVNDHGKDEVIRVKNASLDLDAMIDFKPSDKENTFTTTLIANKLTSDQTEKIRSFLNKKR